MFERGVSYLYRRTLRPFLPAVSPVLYSGIPIGIDRKLGDRFLPSVAHLYGDIPQYEETLVAGLKKYARPGDRVVVVGGGWGITATVAALQVGPGGRVFCFEGGAEACERVRKTAERNGVSDRLSITHAVVGEALHVYGGATAEKVVSPDSLPVCDLLQLDCEGAELAIIREMTIRPRVVLVETHGVYGAPSALVGRLLEQRGYETTCMGIAEPRIAANCIANDVRVIAATRMTDTTG